MTVSKDVRAKEYNGARSASGALKIEKVETHANIKVQGSTASVGAENISTPSVAKTDANVVDLKLNTKALKDFGVDLTSDPTPAKTSKNESQDAPLKAVQAETNSPSYKLLIGIAAGLVVVIAGLTIWSGGLDRAEVAAVAVDAPTVSPVAQAQTTAPVEQQGGPLAPVESVSENEFVAQMTAGTIAALRSGVGASTAPADAAVVTDVNDAKLAAATLFSMVLDATAKDLSAAEIDHMLNTAYADGTIKVPEPFLLSSGRVNTSAIMTAFVGQ